jgi:hypothetical protein
MYKVKKCILLVVELLFAYLNLYFQNQPMPIAIVGQGNTHFIPYCSLLNSNAFIAFYFALNFREWVHMKFLKLLNLLKLDSAFEAA